MKSREENFPMFSKEFLEKLELLLKDDPLL